MKKFGFTLAEILITMGIIGVVAALTAPTLVNNAANAQIRPTLAKVVSTLENANLGMMNHRELNSLAGLNLNEYLNGNQNDGILSIMSGAVFEHVNANPENNVQAADIIHLKGNIDLILGAPNSVANPNNTIATYNRNGGYLGPYVDVIIDIDGAGGDNQLASDRYQFLIDASGSVLPYGGRALFTLDNTLGHWNGNVSGVNNCENVDDAIANGINCAGAVFEDTQIRFR